MMEDREDGSELDDVKKLAKEDPDFAEIAELLEESGKNLQRARAKTREARESVERSNQH